MYIGTHFNEWEPVKTHCCYRTVSARFYPWEGAPPTHDRVYDALGYLPHPPAVLRHVGREAPGLCALIHAERPHLHPGFPRGTAATPRSRYTCPTPAVNLHARLYLCDEKT